jgi:copper chaperone CopZ
VRRALEGLNGVKKAEVSFEKEEAVVYFEDGKTNVEEMIQAVAKAGFRAIEKQGS